MSSGRPLMGGRAHRPSGARVRWTWGKRRNTPDPANRGELAMEVVVKTKAN